MRACAFSHTGVPVARALLAHPGALLEPTLRGQATAPTPAGSGADFFLRGDHMLARTLAGLPPTCERR